MKIRQCLEVIAWRSCLMKFDTTQRCRDWS